MSICRQEGTRYMVDYRNVLQQRENNKPGRPGNQWYLVAAAGAVAVIAPVVVAVLVFRPWQPPPKLPQITLPVQKLLVSPPPPPPVSVFHTMVYPTPQTNLLAAGNMGFLQPTASGRPESGGYGSVRPGKFHEGIDIAATKRGRAGRPLDPVKAVARGMVGHINRIAGNSNYGIYIVLVHDDKMGEVYTLYAHLSEVAPGLSVGQQIEAETVLGTMGNTPVSIIPTQRAHLHFEIGLIANSRFREWFLGRRLKPDHGTYNGWNLMAIDPLAVFARHQSDSDFSFRDHLRTIPLAFEMVVATSRQLDF
ncbi:MAG: M23 family metallopeptidase, partial [bacterium]